MREERRERAVAELLGGVPQAARHEVLALDMRAEHVLAAFGAVGHVALVLEALEQLLDGGVLRRAAAGVEAIDQGADGRRAVVPEAAQDVELGVGHVLRASGHRLLRAAGVCQTRCL